MKYSHEIFLREIIVRCSAYINALFTVVAYSIAIVIVRSITLYYSLLLLLILLLIFCFILLFIIIISLPSLVGNI